MGTVTAESQEVSGLHSERQDAERAVTFEA